MLPSVLQVNEAAGGVARFSFSELCDENRGAADYLAIAQHFHTVFLSNVPVMSLQVRSQPLPSSKHADATCNDSCMVACSTAVEDVSCVTLTSDQVYFLGSSEVAYAPVGMELGREAWRGAACLYTAEHPHNAKALLGPAIVPICLVEKHILRDTRAVHVM